MWSLPGLGMEPVSPTLADGFFITEPPGKPWGQKLSYWSLYSDSQLSYRDKWTFILPALHSPSLILLCITPTSGFMRASGQFNSVQSLSCVQLFATPWTAACQTSLSITNSRSLLKLMSIESVMLSSHLILCRPLLLTPSIFPSIRVFSNWVSSLYQVVRVLEFQLQHQSFQWIFRTDFL